MAKKATNTASASASPAPAPIKKTEAPRAKKHVKAQVAETAAAAPEPPSPEPIRTPQPVASKTVTHEEISRLAYRYYVERNGTHGSPAEDWARAERTLTASV